MPDGAVRRSAGTIQPREGAMSVIVITKFPGKAVELERLAAAEHASTLMDISQDGRSKGALHHMFVEDTDGNTLVIDEWESEASFNAFFAAQDDIKKVAEAGGVTGPPTSTAYRILDTPDRF
jgi:heme-degrading monooxygenase HmoA